MKNFKALTAAGICMAALMIGCALPVSGVSSERFMAEARNSYRSASLVVSGECSEKYTDASGAQVSRVSITRVMGGSAQVGDEITVAQNLSVGESYLLYLSEGEDVHHAEDMAEYVSVSSEPFVIEDNGKVTYGGTKASLSALIKDMKEMDETVTMPAEIYYHDTLDKLVVGSQDIFIGRVVSAGETEKVNFRSQQGGSTVEKTAPASMVSVVAYGSVKGSVAYGSSLTLIYAPDASSNMINAATLEACSVAPKNVPEITEGDTYLIFLDSDPDPKQEYCFPTNPIQGWVKIEGDILYPSEANGALAGYKDLNSLVSDMRKNVR